MLFSINRNSLLSLFLISRTLGKIQSQVDNTWALSSGFPLKNSPVEPFDNHLTDSEQTVDGNGDDDSQAGFQPRSDPLINNIESPTFADGSVECAKPVQSPFKLRRSPLNKRQKSLCPWQEFRDPTSPKSPESEQGTLPPTGAERIWPKLDKERGILRLLLQLERAPGTDGESNLNVCEGTAGRTIPVCFPFRVNHPLVIRSPANLVEPCRFWLNTDVCIETYEELWCCVAAKKRITALLNISPSDFELGLRYSAAGVNCERVVDPVRNLQIVF